MTGDADPVRRRARQKTKPPLDASQASALVRARASASQASSEASVRISLRGATLRDGDALIAVLDAAKESRAKTLNLSGALRSIPGADLRRALATSGALEGLEELSLAETPELAETPRSDDDEMRDVFEALVTVKGLNLMRCGIGGRVWALERAMGTKTATCRSVNLRDNGLDADDARALTRACEANEALESIVMTNNPEVSVEMATAVRERSRINWQRARRMEAARGMEVRKDGVASFRKIGLTDDDVRACIGALLDDGVVIERLDVRDNALSEVGMELLRHELERSPPTTSVNASGNPGFATDSFRRLAGQAAANFIHVDRCDEALKSISDRHVGDEGALVIANALRERRESVRAFGAHHNSIGARGCVELANALLENHRSLREFAVYANDIGVDGAKALARLVEVHGALEVLDSGGNGIGDDGCVAIAEAISRSVNASRLIELHLDHNSISNIGARALLSALRERQAAGNPLRTLWINGNQIDDTLARELTECCSGTYVHDVEGVINRAMNSRGSAPTEEMILVAEREAAAASRMRGSDSSTLANRIAARVGAEYRSRCSAHAAATRGTAVIAGIVAQNVNENEPRDLTVLSLGVGTKFVPGDVAAAIGNRADASLWDAHVHDSHAEVLARRGLLRLLYRELESLVRAGESTFLEHNATGTVALKRDVTIHLYVSTAPCGAASAGPKGVVSHDWNDHDARDLQTHVTPEIEQGWFGPSYKGNDDDSLVEGPPGCVLISHASRAIGVAGKSLSCSDKIARWHAIGVQGALLSHFVEPVRLKSVVIGRKFDFSRCTFATCCRGRRRGDGPRSHPWMMHSTVKLECGGVESSSGGRELAGDGDESISWAFGEGDASAHDGRTGTSLGGASAISICSRIVLWHQFSSLVETIRQRPDCALKDKVPTVEPWSYDQAKRAASTYAAARRALYFD